MLHIMTYIYDICVYMMQISLIYSVYNNLEIISMGTAITRKYQIFLFLHIIFFITLYERQIAKRNSEYCALSPLLRSIDSYRIDNFSVAYIKRWYQRG